MDDHGTHCEGILGAEGNNVIGISGVNQNIKIMALKFLDSEGYGTTDSAISAYKYMLNAKKDGVNLVAVNNSWGGYGYSKSELEAINTLGENGILSICAAGNEANNNDVNINSPCGLDSPYIISVASIGDPEETINEDRVKDLSSFSNYGRTTVDVAAPGGAIYSTILEDKNKNEKKDDYGDMSGTSMATPFITGSVDLLKAYSDEKGWDINEIRARILGGTIKNDSLKDKTLSDGYFNLGVAIDDEQVDPVLNSLEYNSGSHSVTIDGYFFGDTPGTLKIGKTVIKSEDIKWKDKQIEARLPDDISRGIYDFTVINTLGNSGRNDVKINLQNKTGTITAEQNTNTTTQQIITIQPTTQSTTTSTTKSTTAPTQSTLAPTKTTTTTSTQPATTVKLTTTTITEPTTTRPITPTKPNSTEKETGSNSKGFVKDGLDENGFDAWYYYEDNGIKASGWREIDGHMYYFNPDNDNLMQTGWLKTNSGDWYYFDVNVYRKSTRLSSSSEGLGRMHTGWANDGGNEWYYLDAIAETFEEGRGKQVVGWVNDGGNDWYYYDKEEGELALNWELIDGKWYYFSDDENNIATYGQMQRDWQFIDGAWYYFGTSGETDGEMLVGWQVIDGFYYYFYEDGDMAMNIVINGYQIGSDGKSNRPV